MELKKTAGESLLTAGSFDRSNRRPTGYWQIIVVSSTSARSGVPRSLSKLFVVVAEPSFHLLMLDLFEIHLKSVVATFPIDGMAQGNCVFLFLLIKSLHTHYINVHLCFITAVPFSSLRIFTASRIQTRFSCIPSGDTVRFRVTLNLVYESQVAVELLGKLKTLLYVGCFFFFTMFRNGR